MKRHVLIYGVVGGVLVAVLQWTRYRFLVIEHSAEIYGTLIAAILRKRPRSQISVSPLPASS